MDNDHAREPGVSPPVHLAWYGDVAAVSVDGPLTAAGPHLWRELQIVLSSQPLALVCDLTGRGNDEFAQIGLVLGRLAWHAEAWAGLPIVLCASDPSWEPPGHGALRIEPTLAAALAVLGERVPPAQLVIDFPPDARSTTAARHAAQDAARRWDVDAGDLELLVSELVTNAVLHGGGGWIKLSLSSREGQLRVAVRDATPATLTAEPLTDDGLSGRGLALVQALSRAWGTLPTRDGGKVVWCTLAGNPTASGRKTAVSV